MADPFTPGAGPGAGLAIGTLTVRGRGIDAECGRALAEATGRVLAARLPAAVGRIASLRLSLPASALAADGRIDETALAAAIDRRLAQNRAGRDNA